MRFSPCPGCARHVRFDAGACPFCATPVPSGSTAGGRAIGALLVGAVAVSAMAGCRPATKYGGPPLPPEQRMLSEETEPSEPAELDEPSEPAETVDPGESIDPGVSSEPVDPADSAE